MNIDPRLAPVLAERAQRLARPMTNGSTAAVSRGLLCFLAGDEALAVRTDAVAEVQPAPRPAPLPGLPTWVAGMMAFHGRIVPAIRLDRFLAGAPGATFDAAEDMAVVLKANGALLAVLATAVEGIEAPEGEPDPLPAGISPAAWECAVGIHRGRLLIDVHRLVDAIAAALGSSTVSIHQPPLIESNHGDSHANRT